MGQIGSHKVVATPGEMLGSSPLELNAVKQNKQNKSVSYQS